MYIHMYVCLFVCMHEGHCVWINDIWLLIFYLSFFATNSFFLQYYFPNVFNRLKRNEITTYQQWKEKRTEKKHTQSNEFAWRIYVYNFQIKKKRLHVFESHEMKWHAIHIPNDQYTDCRHWHSKLCGNKLSPSVMIV